MRLRPMRRRVAFVALAILSSCAWAERDNRPVWNAFEASLVPDGTAARYATLPLTVPIGFGAILLDTFLVHPVQVIDDAFDDTKDLWRGLDFEEAYFTESMLLPLRAVASPIWFAGSFLGRSFFDVPTAEQRQRRREAFLQRRRDDVLARLGRIAAGEDETVSSLYAPIDDELRHAVARALEGGGALPRISVYEAVARIGPSTLVDWNSAFDDPSAVVRYHLVRVLPARFALSTRVRNRLLSDPDEAVRQTAARRWSR